MSFLAWAVVGAGLGIAVLTPFTIGPWVAAVVIAVAVGLLVARRTDAGSIAGLLAGPAVIAFWIGYLNRDGPGTVCRSHGSGESCIDEWSPWPLLVVGVLLLIASGVIFLRKRRS